MNAGNRIFEKHKQYWNFPNNFKDFDFLKIN
jgi:hypothetical protein